MNLLIDQLPTAVLIDGREYPINSDFRTCLRTIMAFEDDELTGLEKQMIMLENLYPEQPSDPTAACEIAVRFLNGGSEDGEGDGDAPLRLYSFSKDAQFIFSAFRQTHGIDLETAELHWWKFLALFMDLGADTTFSSMIGLRKRILTGKASKEERQAYQEMRDVLELEQPDTRTMEEKEQEAEFMRLVEEARKRRGK